MSELELEVEDEDLINHSEVKWLGGVQQLMEIKEKPGMEPSDGIWLCDLAFMLDITK